jgi:YrbI family 3-deoxy-D-manno-octulosonate 8-phosphate phosphatase
MSKKPAVKIRLIDIDLVIFDFDGVFTDNKVITFQDGREAVVCNRSDGLGIETLRKMNKKMFILSTETNPVVSARANKLKLSAITACGDKASFLKEYLQKEGIDANRVVFLGNDLNDFDAMKLVKYPLCPNDAHPKIKEIAVRVFCKNGGDGVVRELAELLAESQKK